MHPPLLEIKTVPIELQIKTKSASVERTRSTVEMKITRSEQGVNIQSSAIKANWDTFTSSQSGQSAAAAAAVTQATQGAYEVTSAYVDQGSIQLNASIGSYVSDNAAQTQSVDQSGADSNARNIQPTTGVKVAWEDGSMKIRYSVEKLIFDWKIDQGEIEFTPGDIEISVAQRPSIRFKYNGGPFYVPRSADPNYKPLARKPADYKPVDVTA